VFIEELYYKRFGSERPEVVKSIEESWREKQEKSAARKERSRARKLDAQGHREPGASVVTGSEIDIHAEIGHVVDLAGRGEGRLVRLAQLVFFSTESGDAWVVDPEDSLALPLARGGDRLPVHVVDTESQFVIEWTHDYLVDGERFVVREKATGRVTSISGCPTEALLPR